MVVDNTVTFNGYAALEPKATLVPYSYHPRALGDNDVEIKITHCGICGSDIHGIDSGWGPSIYPFIPGHEIVGHVTKAGKDVKHLKVGDRVGVGAQCGACLKSTCPDCPRGLDNCCPEVLYTYNSRYPDGEPTLGGYQESVRLQSDYAFKLPENISSEVVAPLMCAGVTVYAPLKRHGAGPGKRVGVIGIGGLGHLAVQFAHELGAEVTAISSSDSKVADAKKLGAPRYLVSKSKDDIAKHKRYFDIIICTAFYANIEWSEFMGLIRPGGTFIVVGIPEEKIAFDPFDLVANNVNFAGSCIGSRAEIIEMLELAGRTNVRPWTEVVPMDQCNAAVARMRKGDVRFRFVLANKQCA